MCFIVVEGSAVISVVLPENRVELGLELGLVESILLIGVSVFGFAGTTAHYNLIYTNNLSFDFTHYPQVCTNNKRYLAFR